jgi:hypothetical protein
MTGKMCGMCIMCKSVMKKKSLYILTFLVIMIPVHTALVGADWLIHSPLCVHTALVGADWLIHSPLCDQTL